MTAQPPPCPLTARDLAVLALAARGLRNAAIGEALGLSLHDVQDTTRAILRALGVDSRTEAAALALRQGWLPPGDQ